MPANPNNTERVEVISEQYHELRVAVEFYTNSAMAIRRGKDTDEDFSRVWLDSFEKQRLRRLLNDQLGDAEAADTDDEPTDPGRVVDAHREIARGE